MSERNLFQKTRRRVFNYVLEVITPSLERNTRVQAPINAPEQYFNRHLYHSINVQLIAGPDLKIYNAFVEFPGSNHDSYIWRNSAVRNAFEEGGTFPEGWLVADSGYPQEPWVMTPVANVTSPAEHLYNSVHISTRNPIERTNGVLKSRWRVLDRPLAYEPRKYNLDVKEFEDHPLPDDLQPCHGASPGNYMDIHSKWKDNVRILGIYCSCRTRRTGGSESANECRGICSSVGSPHTCLQMTYGEDFPDEIWMVQDNSSVHTSRLVMEWFEENPTYKLIPWPSKSPDLNPIENMHPYGQPDKTYLAHLAGLLYNEETKPTKTRKILTEITVHLETLEVTALIDSGSELSCVSEETWTRILAVGLRPPTLPLHQSSFWGRSVNEAVEFGFSVC
ncbi:hypothetical protein GEV33_003755 [Tenebrio molitor]|uniref:DDE Tnp4 domain-containing protein n=1 Tax=Tenebrio molitor TaxID=7067 RepID=A0A8J6LNC7_TENMO|nr:hypothetical protein GEV33_003755 [Tenebrio molitor]